MGTAATGLRGLKSLLRGLVAMIYPDVCEVCGRALTSGEKLICMHCVSEMPLTGFHKLAFSPIHQRLAPQPPIERTAALFHYYRDDPYARLLQTAKYGNRPTIGRYLGRMLASKLIPENFFEGIDMIVPVPIHWTKRMLRGYNQTEWIARGVSEVAGLPVIRALYTSRRHQSQTRKGIEARARNTAGIYRVRNVGDIKGHHILLIDDIVTTGATLHECAKAIHKSSPDTRISVMTIGATHLR